MSVKKNTILNCIKTFSTIAFPLITFPYVSRVLGAENVGKVNFAQSFVSYFALIAGLGLSTYAVRECSKVRDNRISLDALTSQLFSINIIATVVAYIFMVIILISGDKFYSYKTLIFIESITIVFTTIGTDWLNSAMEDFYFITLRTIGFQCLSLALMFAFVRDEGDYIKYAIVSVISSSGANFINVLYRRKYCKVKFTTAISWKSHMKPIIFLFVMAFSQTIFNNVDVTMLGLMKGDYEVGIYSTANKVTRIISQMVSSVAFVIIPTLSRYFADGNFDEANKLLKKVLLFNITLGLPCVVGVIMLADDIIYLVGGEGYVGAEPVIRILILSFMFSLVGGSFLGNAILIPMQQEGYYMVVCLVTAVINAVLNGLLIPCFSAVGAAMATAFNGFLIFALLACKIDSRIKIGGLRKVFLPPVVGCCMIVVICGICSQIVSFLPRVLISVLSSTLVYGCIQVVLNNEIVTEMLHSMMNNMKGRIK